jgi:hypothetical protein
MNQNNTDMINKTSAAAGSPWQLMGSEPKDGTRFLCYVSGDEIHSASWYCDKLCGTPGVFGYPHGIGRHRAKYWMPIPSLLRMKRIIMNEERNELNTPSGYVVLPAE